MAEFLSQNEVPFIEKDITQDPAAVDELIAAGVQSTPAVRVGGEWMVGFRGAALLKLING